MGKRGSVAEWPVISTTLTTGERPVSKPRLVVIDVLQRIKPQGGGNLNAYEREYAIIAPLQRWATNQGIAVVVLHHTQEGGAEDPLEALSGSNGLSACADTTLVSTKKGTTSRFTFADATWKRK